MVFCFREQRGQGFSMHIFVTQLILFETHTITVSNTHFIALF